MTLLEALAGTRLAEALGWALVHSLWEGAIISAVLAAVLFVVRSPRARYAAACGALLLMAGGFGITLAHFMAANAYGPQLSRIPAFHAWNIGAGNGNTGSWNGRLAALVPWLAPLWIAGVWIFALRHGVGWASVARLRRRGVCCAPERWQEGLARLSSRFRLSRSVRLLESCLAGTPMVIGHLRPVILMPVGLLAGLPAGQIEAILLHELAHIRRRDYLVNLLQRSVECLFFYHPAVWWIGRVIRDERENCCDDVAVALGGNAREYAVALAALEQERSSSREPAVAAKGGSLVKRIRRLLDSRGANGAWTPLLAAVILAATVAVATAAWPMVPARQGSTSVQRRINAGENPPAAKWADGPVSYIILPRERAAYIKLTTDAERDMFIKRFWERRNPNPGSTTNAFKKEFYRRVAFADWHFAAGIPGWETDRGHIYIVYGPPDQITLKTHPSASQTTALEIWKNGRRIAYSPPHHMINSEIPRGAGKLYSYEVWTYRHLMGIGDNVSVTFIDRTGTGDYQLAPGKTR